MVRERVFVLGNTTFSADLFDCRPVDSGIGLSIIIDKSRWFLLVRNDEVRRLISTRMEEIGFF